MIWNAPRKRILQDRRDGNRIWRIAKDRNMTEAEVLAVLEPHLPMIRQQYLAQLDKESRL